MESISRLKLYLLYLLVYTVYGAISFKSSGETINTETINFCMHMYV